MNAAEKNLENHVTVQCAQSIHGNWVIKCSISFQKKSILIHETISCFRFHFFSRAKWKTFAHFIVKSYIYTSRVIIFICIYRVTKIQLYIHNGNEVNGKKFGKSHWNSFTMKVAFHISLRKKKIGTYKERQCLGIRYGTEHNIIRPI